MNSGLDSLLRQAGIDTSGPRFWQRVVILHNVGMVPAQIQDEGDVVTARGFNALVMNEDGTPAYFCKCRPPTKDWIRQTELVAKLSMDPSLQHILPSAWAVGSADMQISVSTYVPGRLLERTVAHMSATELHTALTELLQGMETIAAQAAVVQPDLFDGETQVDLAERSKWAFDAIPPSMLPPHAADRLRAAIAAAGRVRRVFQHGDLWPRNILRHRGQWWLLDLELFGQIQVPLYDAFHLFRTCWFMRAGRFRKALSWMERSNGHDRSWIEDLSAASDSPRPYHRTLAWARARSGLTAEEAVGALAYYLIDMTARMNRRQIVIRYVEPYVRDLRVLAQSLATDSTIVDRFRHAS